jgi:uncharacterized protein (DUF58 family)
MLSKDVFKQIQRFHFQTRRLANDAFAGQYVSAFKGRGMEFSEVREYQPGDDIRTIDWNVTARFGHPFVKVFHEERELTVMLLLDVSGSHRFGTRARFKRELLAEVAGMLAFLAIRTNDKVGAILFSSRVEKLISPGKGASHVWRLIKEIFTYQPEDPTTDIDAVLVYVNRMLKRHAIVFLISDCMDAGFERSLQLTARKHDLTVIRVRDPAEMALPEVGYVMLRDPETGAASMINTRSRAMRERWQTFHRERDEGFGGLLKRSGVDLVDLTTDGPVVEPLARLFHARRKRM